MIAPPYELAQPMATAPKDGRKILIRFEHMNYAYADDANRWQWEDVLEAMWIDFNRGGWTWHGLCGAPTCWWPIELSTDGGRP